MSKLHPATENKILDLESRIGEMNKRIAEIEGQVVPAAIADHERRFSMWGALVAGLAIALWAVIRFA